MAFPHLPLDFVIALPWRAVGPRSRTKGMKAVTWLYCNSILLVFFVALNSLFNWNIVICFLIPDEGYYQSGKFNFEIDVPEAYNMVVSDSGSLCCVSLCFSPHTCNVCIVLLVSVYCTHCQNLSTTSFSVFNYTHWVEKVNQFMEKR